MKGSQRSWQATLTQRLHERPFWIVQIGVLAVTGAHLAVEAAGLQGDHRLGGLGYAPVVFHAAPVAYAGLRYGYEGSLLTSLWTIVLVLPNLFLWHSEGFGWVPDLLFLAFVLVLGVAVALPVERERTQRERAESASSRLATLLSITSRLAGSTDVTAEVDGVLRELTARDDVSGAWLVDGEGATVAQIGGAADAWEEFPVPCATADVEALRVATTSAIDEDGRSLFRAIASQLAVALDRWSLHAQERDRLTSYVQEVTRAQERERARLARDLHDVVAQDLVRLTRQLDDAPQAAPLAATARDALGALRRYSRDLRPTVLDDLGLVPALHWLADHAATEDEVQVEVDVQNIRDRFHPDIELALFRVTQEALRNAVRHGQAGTVEIRLDGTDRDVIRLEVRDDGQGFVVPEPLEALAQSGSLGLLGMRERVQLVGGEFRLESSRGQGCLLVAAVPSSLA